MKARFATQSEIDNWNNLIIANPDGGNLFQSKQFAELKSNNNWKPLFLECDGLYFMVLERIIPLLGSFWYVPKGPGISDIAGLKKILKDIKIFGRDKDVFLIRIEPELLETDKNLDALEKLHLPVFSWYPGC